MKITIPLTSESASVRLSTIHVNAKYPRMGDSFDKINQVIGDIESGFSRMKKLDAKIRAVHYDYDRDVIVFVSKNSQDYAVAGDENLIDRLAGCKHYAVVDRKYKKGYMFFGRKPIEVGYYPDGDGNDFMFWPERNKLPIISLTTHEF